MNLTWCEAIEAIAGDPDTDTWLCTRIKIVRGSTRYQGKKVACIAIEAPDDIDQAMPTTAAERL